MKLRSERFGYQGQQRQSPRHRIEEAYVLLPPYGTFPVDMLRYDACWPITSRDATLISADASILAPDDQWRIVGVQAIRLSGGCPQWTFDRWESFGVALFPSRAVAEQYRQTMFPTTTNQETPA